MFTASFDNRDLKPKKMPKARHAAPAGTRAILRTSPKCYSATYGILLVKLSTVRMTTLWRLIVRIRINVRDFCRRLELVAELCYAKSEDKRKYSLYTNIILHDHCSIQAG